MTSQEDLALRCTEVAQTAGAALDWVRDEANADTVGLARKSLVQSLRKARRRAEKLAASARTKMSVSVFGPSQAGKSFLVSVLARPRDGRLVADFPGEGGRLDYIREINPEGEGESTGLVTRFTMSRDPCPPGFPIKLVLLTEADVARTIINSFYMDGDQSEPPPEPADLTAHLDAFRAKAGPAELPGMSFEEVMEVADYVNNTFGRSAYGAALRGFWDEAAVIAPNLAPKDRAEFYAILWGRHEPLTGLYLKLAEALGRIQHAPVVHAPLAALIPRDSSIIDVKTLHGLFGGSDALRLHLPSGAVAELPRALVCALAAELVMPMETEPSPIFAETDLLDFPGARNRFEQPLSKTLAKPEETLSQLLLRGKVAYLFDRYVESQEITSMLLCVPDSNMETLDLPGLVENWIAMTHGPTPAARAQTDCILFFVLTKFDKHLGESAAAGGVQTRFERRIQASLLEKFGKSRDAWVESWTPGEPFRNCYWLRNPNFFVEGLIDYDEGQRELRIRPEKEGRIAELREGCLAAESVQRHFADASAAWDAALALNDGGVDYLIRELTRVCKPASKIRQIGAQVETLAQALADDLGRYYLAEDLDRRIEEKRSMAWAITDELEIALSRHRFGALLAALMVDQEEVQDRIARVPSSIRITSAVASAAPAVPGAPAGGLIRPGVPARPGRPGPAAVAAPETPAPARIRTMAPETFQAESAVEVWIDTLNRLRDDAETIGHFGMTQGSVANLNAELVHGLRRSGVLGRMQAGLRAMAFGHTVDKQAEPAAIVCSEAINGFVLRLGADLLPEKDRPRVDLGGGESRAVFAPRPASDEIDGLPEQPRAASSSLWTDWVFALEAMFVANAKDTGGGAQIDTEQNYRLGRVLARLGGEGGEARVA